MQTPFPAGLLAILISRTTCLLGSKGPVLSVKEELLALGIAPVRLATGDIALHGVLAPAWVQCVYAHEYTNLYTYIYI